MPFNITGTKIQVACLIYISLWCTAPPLGYALVFRLLAILALMLWLIIETQQQINIIKYPTYPCIAVFFYLAYISILEIFVDDGITIVQNIQIYILLLFLVFQQGHFKRSVYDLVPILWTILLSYPLWSLRSIYALLQDPKVMRTIVRSSGAAKELALSGIGGYGFAYSLVFLLPCLIILYFNREKLKPLNHSKYLIASILLNIAISSIVILLSGYSIAIISTSTIITILFFFNKNKIVTNSIIIVLLTTIGISIPYLIKRYYFQLLELTFGTNYYAKIRDINVSLQSSEVSGTLADRVERYLRSIEYFSHNPIFGTLSKANLGKHSMIIDHFAQFGVGGGILFLTIIFWQVLHYYKYEKKGKLSLAIGIAILLIFGLNNAVFNFGPILFILYPLSIILTRDNIQHNDIKKI